MGPHHREAMADLDSEHANIRVAWLRGGPSRLGRAVHTAGGSACILLAPARLRRRVPGLVTQAAEG